MDILERVAEALHEGWMMYRWADGTRYGPVKVDKFHPHMRPLRELELEAQNQDRFQAARILTLWAEGAVTADTLPEIIHESWRLWEVHIAKNASHHHAKPFAEAHAQSPDEHQLQSNLVWKILQSL